MVTKTIYTEVDVDLSDFDDDEILDELADRGLDRDGRPTGEILDMLNKLYEAKKYGLGDFETLFSEACYVVLGKNL